MNQMIDRKVNVVRITATKDGYGTQSEVEVILHYNLPCRITENRGDEGKTFGSERQTSSHTMYCKIVDITAKDRVIDGSLKYEILDISNKEGRFLRLKLGLVQ